MYFTILPIAGPELVTQEEAVRTVQGGSCAIAILYEGKKPT